MRRLGGTALLLRSLARHACLQRTTRQGRRQFSAGGLVRWKAGPFNSVNLDASAVTAADAPAFLDELRALVQGWRAAQCGAVWIELRASQGALIEGVAAAGFAWHHALGDRCSMLLWLQDRPCPVPPFATHHVGVGGVVLDGPAGERRVLLVKDRHARAPQAWKFPGGLANLGEDVGVAAAREVFEETGVRTELRSILAARHMHGLAFGNSDLYVFCHLRALSTAITADPVEILDARWMDVAEFLASTRHPLSRHAVQVAAAELDRDGGEAGTTSSGTWKLENVYVPTLGKAVAVYRGSAVQQEGPGT